MVKKAATTTKAKKKGAAAPKTVKLRFPKLAAFLKMCNDNSASIDFSTMDLTIENPDCLFPDFAAAEATISVVLGHFGEIVEFRHGNNGGYLSIDEHSYYYPKEEARFLSKICEVVSGEPLVFQDPVLIDEDDNDYLTFNEEDSTFVVGCKSFSTEKADEIFRFLGKNLGYTIT